MKSKSVDSRHKPSERSEYFTKQILYQEIRAFVAAKNGAAVSETFGQGGYRPPWTTPAFQRRRRLMARAVAKSAAPTERGVLSFCTLCSHCPTEFTLVQIEGGALNPSSIKLYPELPVSPQSLSVVVKKKQLPS